MFKNAVISLLAVALFVQTECYISITGPVLYLLTAAVLFFALAAVEEKVKQVKRRLNTKKMFQQQLNRLGVRGR